MAAGLGLQSDIENDSVHHQESTHTQKKCAFGRVLAEESAYQEAERNSSKEKHRRVQCPHLHGLTRSLPLRGNVYLRQFHCQCQRTNLREVKYPQPLQPAVGVAHT